ncbi:hypothetical protein C9374_010132 [Naegleria lovaniensis]|uniref:Uncharacterized protein n=1 Tax=Naegleria lovaniensis TaxID=51637 RepID=A0AA88GH79_NAELO|nr:uncharacterized protein C9374_010132 [Naegleria lovaniensis]KAG2375128.1 hypothetical protein C9374_010132 [Naegleria lovaniensis]
MGQSSSTSTPSPDQSKDDDVKTVHFDLFNTSDESSEVSKPYDLSSQVVDYFPVDKFENDQELNKKREYLWTFMNVYSGCTDIASINFNGPQDLVNLDNYVSFCAANELKRLRDGKGVDCYDDLGLNVRKHRSPKEIDELIDDLNYCLESSAQTKEELSNLSNARMKWTEPNTLVQLMPKIGQLLKSKQLTREHENEPSNLLETYSFENKDMDKKKEIAKYLSDTIALKQTKAYDECMTKAKDLPDHEHVTYNCAAETLKLGYLMGSVACKKQLLDCISRENQPFGYSLTETSVTNFIRCASEVPCFAELEAIWTESRAGQTRPQTQK